MYKKLFLLFLLASLVSCISQPSTDKKFDKSQAVAYLNTFMDNWHHAAAVADENVFFGAIDTTGVYLGTDPGERWTKKAFMDWGMKYFTTRDTAWAFTPYNRIWDFSENGKTAWFDELLKTHMGICRGSGVLIKVDTVWKIKQYNLAVAVPNEKMNEYRKIVGVKILK